MIGQMIPWMACGAASAGVMGVFLFGLRGDPVDLGKYLGAASPPASALHSVSSDPARTVSEGSGRIAAEEPADPTPEPQDAGRPAALPAPQAEIVPPQAAPQRAGDVAVAGEPASMPDPAPMIDPMVDPMIDPMTETASAPEPGPVSEPASPTESASVAQPADTGALALLSPEPPREAAPAPRARPPRARSIRRPARVAAVSSVQRRARAAVRRIRGPAMQTITIYHGPYIEVIRVPR